MAEQCTTVATKIDVVVSEVKFHVTASAHPEQAGVLRRDAAAVHNNEVWHRASHFHTHEARVSA